MSALETERGFTALTQADVPALEEILAPDLSMVALNGSVLDRASLTRDRIWTSEVSGNPGD